MSRVPRIRFKGFEEDWEQRKLGEIAERIIRKNEKLESTLPLTISAQYGLIDQNEFFDKRIASKDVRGYYLIKKGEFAYNKSTSVDAPFGAIKRLDKYKNGVLSTLYILFKIIDDTSTSSDYLVTYYFTDLWHNGIQSIAAEGARNHGLLNIAPNDFFETMLSIPLNISEQKKVGGFFISLDHLITLHQSKSFWYILKSILSCTLYWEQRKLISCLSLLKDGTHGTHKDYPSGPLLLSAKNIKNGRVYYDETDRRISYKDFEKIHSNFKLQVGDVLLTIVGSIGETALLQNTFGLTFQRSVAFLRVTDNIIPEFLMSEINTSRFKNELENRKSTSAQPGIYLGDLGEIPVFISKNLDEQLKIGSYFDSLNHLITLHQLEPYKLILKAIAYRIIDYAESKLLSSIK